MSRTLTYGMVGGGPGAFIGEAHRKAIALDGSARLVAGCFSRSPEKTRALGEELGLDPERCYADYRDMARAEAQELFFDGTTTARLTLQNPRLWSPESPELYTAVVSVKEYGELLDEYTTSFGVRILSTSFI